MKPIISFLCLFSILLCSINCHSGQSEQTVVQVNDSQERASFLTKAAEAKKFCIKSGMNTSFCLLANMHMHSGKIRMYVWDLQQNKPIDSGLVSHGCGSKPWGRTDSKEAPTFSNTDGSHCTSLGKYKVGKRGYSQWGINVNYLLHGLDASNSNALVRQVVLHSWDVVAEQAVYPNGTPEGWGCPAISNGFMKRIDEKLKTVKKPVLLWQFNAG